MKLAIAGYGIEGEQNYIYWSNLGADITIFDESEQTARPLPNGVKTRLGSGVFSNMDGYDLVIRTASLSPSKIKTDGKIWSATNEFFDKCPAKVIGVTGTKGKGTTCSLIAEILKQSGKTVHLVGNIGIPALEVLPKIKNTDLVVFELSSFQLWDIKKSPETAVILMIEPDHLDVHSDIDDYVTAKSNIGRFQKPENLLVVHPTNQLSQQAASPSPAKKLRYMTDDGAHLQNSSIAVGDNIICDVNEVGLIGNHNLENVCAAITASWNYTNDLNAIKTAVVNFKGLPHRLEFVRELGGVKYYDDSYSPNPASTIAAIKSFDDPIVLIAGGYDRGADFTNLAQSIAESSVKKVILIGQTASKIASALDSVGCDIYKVVGTTNFEDIVIEAQKSAGSGDIIVLSPGCPSFDMFKNFEERGKKFKQIVKGLI